MKNKIIAALLLLWVLAIMGGIFWLSSRTAEESGNMSQNVTDEIFDPSVPVDKETAAKRHHNVRKSAHILEYGVLGNALCLFLFFIADANFIRSWSRWFLAFWAWIGSTVYAMTDEIHQIFVPGRGPSVTDVAIDTVGALLGVLSVWAFCRFVLKGKNISVRESEA